MKTKHRTASKAKRKWQADPSTIYRTIGRHQEFTVLERGQVVTPVRMAYEKFRMGTAEETDFHTLAAACNVSLISAEKISPLVESVCLVASDALLRCKERHARTGRWGFDGPALSAIADMIDIFEQLVELHKPVQLQNAMTEALRRTRTGQGLHQPDFQPPESP